MRVLRVSRRDNHMKLRSVALAAAALALPASAVIAGSVPSGAATTTVTFAGTLNGNLTGSITIKPALTNTASTVPIKFTTTWTDSSLVASKGLTQKGVTISGGKSIGTVTVPAGATCTSLQNGFPPASNTTKYTATGVGASATHFKPGKVSLSIGATVTATLGGAGTTTSGSFKNGAAGSAASTATLHIDQSAATLFADCGGAGLSKITFTGATGTSTFMFG